MMNLFHYSLTVSRQLCFPITLGGYIILTKQHETVNSMIQVSCLPFSLPPLLYLFFSCMSSA
jgi:hypothetical protein